MATKVKLLGRPFRTIIVVIVTIGFVCTIENPIFTSVRESYAQNIPAPILHFLSEKDTYITRNGAPSNDGDPVGWWLDQSGLGNHASYYISLARRPKILSNIVNGYPVVSFSVDDALTGSWSQSPTGGTVIYVFRLNDASSYGYNPYLLRLQGTFDHGRERVAYDWIKSTQLFRMGIR